MCGRAPATRSKRRLVDAQDKIVFDRFYVVKHMGEAVDEVHEREPASCAPRGSTPRPDPVIDVAYMMKRHLYGVLNYFSAARITNAAAEGLNSKLRTIKKMAYGYRNREHFKRAIFFHCGGLQVYPATHGIPG